ncbi:MAG TPA: hypothetical protein VIL44_03280 [Micromonospora sp.]
MTDRHAELEAALERVVDAARRHLAAVRDAAARRTHNGRVDDSVWQAYVALNNAAYAYDALLAETYGEVTPWEVEPIDPDEAANRAGGGVEGELADPHPHVISVRQRRDYRVPSVTALLRVAEATRHHLSDDGADDPVETVGEAVLELLQAGDGSLNALDIPELEPLDGVVVVHEVAERFNPDAFADDDSAGPFVPAPGDRLVGRLDEHPYLPTDPGVESA